MSVDYSHYYSQITINVEGLFVHRVIDMLELGKSEYIVDPIGFCWGLIQKILSKSNNLISSENIEIPLFSENQFKGFRGRLLLLRALHILLLRYFIISIIFKTK